MEQWRRKLRLLEMAQVMVKELLREQQLLQEMELVRGLRLLYHGAKLSKFQVKQ